MSTLQEIVFITDKGVKLNFHVSPDVAGNIFSAILLHLEPGLLAEDTMTTAIAYKVNGAEKVFEECMRYVVNICKTKEDEVVSINNPCNCKFVPLEIQQKIVSRKLPNIQVTVNA